jgi:hypothetical protein
LAPPPPGWCAIAGDATIKASMLADSAKLRVMVFSPDA